METRAFSKIIVCLTLIAFSGWFAATSCLGQPGAAEIAAQPPWPHELSDLPPDPSITWGRLDSGLRYVVMPNPEPRHRVSLRLYVQAGSLQEKEHQRGLAHYLEHMGFNGTENFDPEELVQYFQRLGMSFGADINAYTSFNRTVYMIELPDAERDSIDEALLVLRDFADRMLLDEKEVEAERGVMLGEMRARDSVEFRTALAEYSFLLPESLIPKRFPIGTEDVLRNATRDDIADYFDAWYRPERTIIVVVGEVEPETISELMKKQFGDFTPRAPARETPDLGRVVSHGLQARLHTEMEAQATRVSIHAIQPYEDRPDTLDRRIEWLRRTAAARMLTRRLDVLAQRDGSPFSRGSAVVYDLFDFAAGAVIELMCEPENWEESLALAEQELRRALEFGFQPAELREAQAAMITSYREAVKRAPTRQSDGLAASIISSIAAGRVFTSPETELALMERAIEEMTVDDALSALREVWSPEGRFIFVTGNLLLENPDERILAVFRESQSRPVDPPEKIIEVEFAYTDFGPAGEIAERRHVEDLDIHQVRFANNARLNVKRTDFQANTIHVHARIGSGRLTEPKEKQGVALLANLAFIQGGLGKHGADELRRILAGRNVGVSFSAGSDAFQLSGSTTPADLLLQLRLAAAYLTDPGYRPEALRLAHNSLRELYRESRHTAEGVIQSEVAGFLAGGDHRFGLPPEDRVMALTLDNLRAWLDEPLASCYLELTIIGDLSVEETIQAVAQTFGALPMRAAEKPPLHELRRVEFPRGVSEMEFRFESAIPSAYVLVYWPTDDMWDIRQTRRLGILARVFSDRMRVRIREEMGEAYGPYAISRPSDTYENYGLFAGIVDVDPARARKVADAVVEIARDIARGGVTEDELARIVRPVLMSLRDAMRDNSYWLNSVMANSWERPQRLEWSREMIADFQSITVEEINELARRFLDTESALRIHVIPVTDVGAAGSEAAGGSEAPG